MVESKTNEWIDLCNPATNEVKRISVVFFQTNVNISEIYKVITKVPKATREEMEAAVESAKSAYKTWSKTSILTRQQVMLRYQHIIRNNMVNKIVINLDLKYQNYFL